MYGYSLGRFTSPDPLAASANPIRPQSWNRYSYSYNNPLRFTDPSGMIAGDFYNLNGKKIGTDGVDDEKIHVVYDEKKAKEIEKTKGNYTGTVDAKITLPGVNIVTAVNEAVNRSDAATFDKSGLAPLEKNQTENGGGFREAGITWDKDGKVTVEPDGKYADPRVEGASMVISPNTEGSAHVHPSGIITTTTRVIGTDAAGNTGPGTSVTKDFIKNIPSPADYTNAARGANIMVGGSGNNRSVTFYNQNGNLATMSYKNFKKLGAK